MKKAKRASSKVTNLGIQADSVRAEVLAVGHGAKAVQYVTLSSANAAQLKGLLESLGQGVREVVKDPSQRQVVEQDLKELEQAATQRQANPSLTERILKGLVDKLRMVGTVVKEVSGICTPLEGLCKLFGISLRSLGLG